MMNNYSKIMSKLMLIVVATGVVFMCSCKEDTIVPNANPIPSDTTDVNPGVSKFESLIRDWRIDTATHKNQNDISSTGKTIEFFADGEYRWDDSFDGVWEFSSDSSTIIIDKGESLEQVWKVNRLTEAKLDVDFKSPFTGGASRWIMSPNRF